MADHARCPDDDTASSTENSSAFPSCAADWRPLKGKVRRSGEEVSACARWKHKRPWWKVETNSLAVPLILSARREKGEAQRKESAAQAYVTLCKKRGPTRGPTLLKRHYKRQTGGRNPAALGGLIQAQQKECPFAAFCRRATRTTLSCPRCSFALRITTN